MLPNDAIDLLRDVSSALAPFARPSIPKETPDSLWTSCKTYPCPLTEDRRRTLAKTLDCDEDEIEEERLALWIDGHPISDFRRAKEVHTRLTNFLSNLPENQSRFPKDAKAYRAILKGAAL